MVEVLFLGTFIVFFFLPVQFGINYQKTDRKHFLVFEMRFLNGLLQRKLVIDPIQPNLDKLQLRKKMLGKWFFFSKTQIKEETTSYGNSSGNGLEEFLLRYKHYGIGITLLTYFIPAKYHHWLLVVEDLEKKGHFQKFTWITKLGTGGPASTAIFYGLLWGLKLSLISYLSQQTVFARDPEIQVIPDFQNLKFEMVFDCIFRVKLGYIIIAAFIARFRHRWLKGGVGIERTSD